MQGPSEPHRPRKAGELHLCGHVPLEGLQLALGQLGLLLLALGLCLGSLQVPLGSGRVPLELAALLQPAASRTAGETATSRTAGWTARACMLF